MPCDWLVLLHLQLESAAEGEKKKNEKEKDTSPHQPAPVFHILFAEAASYITLWLFINMIGHVVFSLTGD